MLMVLAADSPIPCKILPKIMVSKLSACKQIKLANIKSVNPMYTIGFRPKLSERGPNNNGPIPKPKKIIEIISWFSLASIVPIEMPIRSKAGNSASIAKATTDINEAIKAINSNCWSLVFFTEQK